MGKVLLKGLQTDNARGSKEDLEGTEKWQDAKQLQLKLPIVVQCM
jgi:hypothetical protein